MPVSCHFQDCKALLVASLTRARGAIASTRPLPLPLPLCCAAVVFHVHWFCVAVLYAASISVAVAPGDVTSYVEFLKNLNLSAAIWFPLKATCAFPLVYHYINGIRHLVCISTANIRCFQDSNGTVVKSGVRIQGA